MSLGSEHAGKFVGCSWIGFGTVKLRSPLCMYCLYLTRMLRRGDVEEILGLLEGLDSRTRMFTESFEAVAGDRDPYFERKLGLNLRVLSIVGRLPSDGLNPEWLVRLSAAANVVDIEVPGYSFEEEVLERLGGLMEKVVFRAGRGFVCRLVGSARRVVFLLDNAGEAIFDVFVAAMLALRGARVYLVARKLPYEVDVTASEVEWIVDRVLGLLRAGGLRGRIEVVDTGGRYPAFAFDHVDPRVVEILSGADVVLSKGIANLEAYMDYREAVDEVLDSRRLVFLLCAKCPILARLFDVERGVPVVFSPAWFSWC